MPAAQRTRRTRRAPGARTQIPEVPKTVPRYHAEGAEGGPAQPAQRRQIWRRQAAGEVVETALCLRRSPSSCPTESTAAVKRQFRFSHPVTTPFEKRQTRYRQRQYSASTSRRSIEAGIGTSSNRDTGRWSATSRCCAGRSSDPAAQSRARAASTAPALGEQRPNRFRHTRSIRRASHIPAKSSSFFTPRTGIAQHDIVS